MLIATFSQYFFGIAIFLSSLFLVMLVLVQRGRGGGLTGALGGPGGQSAFGTKAGDLFTRITIGVAAVWIFLCASAVVFLKSRGLPQTGGSSAASSTMGAGAGGIDTSGKTAPGDGGSLIPGGAGAGIGADLPSLPASPEGTNTPPGDPQPASGEEPSGVQAEVTDLPADPPASDPPVPDPPASDPPVDQANSPDGDAGTAGETPEESSSN